MLHLSLQPTKLKTYTISRLGLNLKTHPSLANGVERGRRRTFDDSGSGLLGALGGDSGSGNMEWGPSQGRSPVETGDFGRIYEERGRRVGVGRGVPAEEL